MNLIDQLRQILAQDNVLPEDPNLAISGTELLAKVHPRLEGDYSDNSLRQSFSVLAADATSAIARTERGYGYYRRPPSQQVDISSPQQHEPSNEIRQPSEEHLGREVQLEEKFRAFYLRYVKLANQFPLRIDHVNAQRRQAGVNKWKFPDAVSLKWDVGESSDLGFSLDKSALEVKRGLGEQPFRLNSIELKVELSLGSFREYFFQCVSNSMWAHSALLVVACPVVDALLANELRRLGASYGVGISTFDFSRSRLDGLPTATHLMNMPDSDFEELASAQQEATLSAAHMRTNLDWEHIKDIKTQSPEFSEMFDWIARCLRDKKAYSIEHHRSLRDIEVAAG